MFDMARKNMVPYGYQGQKINAHSIINVFCSRVLGQASMVCGGFLQFLSFCLMAPIPFVSKFVTPTTSTVIALQVLFGIGLSCSLLPSYNEMVKSTISNGTRESIMVYGRVVQFFLKFL